MGDIPLYLSNVSVSIGQTVELEQAADRPPQPGIAEPGRDFESVELEAEQHQQQREKIPRRIIHFSSGETMEEYSTDEEEDEEEVKMAERKDLLSSSADATKLTWGPYVWFHMWRAATSTISACDYLGERMASFFGITSAKYQYAIDEYYRIKKEREEEKEENRLSEEAERSCDPLEDEDEVAAAAEMQRVAAARPDRSHQVQSESSPPSCVITVPAIVTAT